MIEDAVEETVTAFAPATVTEPALSRSMRVGDTLNVLVPLLSVTDPDTPKPPASMIPPLIVTAPPFIAALAADVEPAAIVRAPPVVSVLDPVLMAIAPAVPPPPVLICKVPLV